MRKIGWGLMALGIVVANAGLWFITTDTVLALLVGYIAGILVGVGGGLTNHE